MSKKGSASRLTTYALSFGSYRFSYSIIIGQYYSRALSSPWGQKVFQFYTTTAKQVFDIHEEARRIADTHKNQSTGDQHQASTSGEKEAPPADPAVAGTSEKAQ